MRLLFHRWGLMADPLGEPSPLPDRHFKEDRRSNILRRRSNQATEHIKQRINMYKCTLATIYYTVGLAAIDDVVTSATPTKLQGMLLQCDIVLSLSLQDTVYQ